MGRTCENSGTRANVYTCVCDGDNARVGTREWKHLWSDSPSEEGEGRGRGEGGTYLVMPALDPPCPASAMKLQLFSEYVTLSRRNDCRPNIHATSGIAYETRTRMIRPLRYVNWITCRRVRNRNPSDRCTMDKAEKRYRLPNTLFRLEEYKIKRNRDSRFVERNAPRVRDCASFAEIHSTKSELKMSNSSCLLHFLCTR